MPSSIRYLATLSFLNLTDCENLENIPNSICELKYLKCLNLQNCVKLNFIPEKLGSMKILEELWLGFTHNIGRPQEFIGFHSLTGLSSLRKLNLSWMQIEEESFPKNPDALSSLEELYLSGNCKLVRLPSIISHLSCLKRLELNECSRLQSLCALPLSIQVLKANECYSLEKIGDLSKESKWLYKIWLIQSEKLLENEENQRYLDKILQLSFIKKCAAVNHRASIIVPGNKIPSWFKEKKCGCRIALKLPHKWHTEVTGFILCGVFHGGWYSVIPRIIFRILSDRNVILKSEVDSMKNATKIDEIRNVWISYIPLDLFQQMYQDLVPEDWSHIEGYLDMTVMLTDGRQSVRGGAHVVYKGDVESPQHIPIFDYGSMVHVDDEDLGYAEVICGKTYVYEEKFEDKSLMPLKSRTSTRRSTKSVCYVTPHSCNWDFNMGIN